MTQDTDGRIPINTMLGLLAKMGMSRGALTAMTSFAYPDTPEDDLAFLNGPVVVHESPWNDTRPDWIVKQIPAERLAIITGATPHLIVGPAEVLAVMYGATLDGPLRSPMADLYGWATAHAVEVERGIPAGETFAKLAMTPIEHRQLRGGMSELSRAYEGLAAEIRRKVVQAGGRVRLARKPMASTPEAAPVLPVAPTVQTSLFSAMGMAK